MATVTVTKEDLSKIGHTQYQEDGNLCVLCDINTANIEEIFLRTILTCFGEEYKIVDTEDFEDENGNFEIVFITNLPVEIAWEKYNKKEK